jgi:hypothetical protein
VRLHDLRMRKIHLAEVRRMLPTLPRATACHVAIPRTATRRMATPREACLRPGMLPTVRRELEARIAGVEALTAEARRHRGDRTAAVRPQEGEADTLPTALLPLHIVRRPAVAEDLMARAVLEDATKQTSLHSHLLPEAASFF